MKTSKSDTKKNHLAGWFLYCCLHNVLEQIVNESKSKVQGLNKAACAISQGVA